MQRKLLFACLISFLVTILVVCACFLLSKCYYKEKRYTEEELHQIQEERLNQVYRNYREYGKEEDAWIQYCKIWYSSYQDNCIIVIVLEENKEHLPEIKEHLEGCPVDYRITDQVEKKW